MKTERISTNHCSFALLLTLALVFAPGAQPPQQRERPAPPRPLAPELAGQHQPDRPPPPPPPPPQHHRFEIIEELLKEIDPPFDTDDPAAAVRGIEEIKRLKHEIEEEAGRLADWSKKSRNRPTEQENRRQHEQALVLRRKQHELYRNVMGVYLAREEIRTTLNERLEAENIGAAEKESIEDALRSLEYIERRVGRIRGLARAYEEEQDEKGPRDGRGPGFFRWSDRPPPLRPAPPIDQRDDPGLGGQFGPPRGGDRPPVPPEEHMRRMMQLVREQQQSIETLEARVRELEADLEEARKSGSLPTESN